MSPDDVKAIVLNIEQTIKIDKAKDVKGQNSQQQSIADMKNYFQRKYPQETEDKIMIRVLDHMKNQFFSSFPSKAASNEDGMSTSSFGSKDFEDDIAGESQPAEPTLEDVWDSMIAHMTK